MEQCNFKPLKKGVEKCSLAGEIRVGESFFCKTHSKSKQALECKRLHQQRIEEEERVKAAKLEEEKKAILEERERLKAEKNALQQELERKDAEEKRKELEAAEKAAKIDVLKSFEFKETVTKIGSRTELNSWGRYEDPESNYVFANSKCYGRQLPDGRVARLTPKDIEILRQFEVSYQGDGDPEEVDSDYETVDETTDDESMEEVEDDDEVEEEIEDAGSESEEEAGSDEEIEDEEDPDEGLESDEE